MDLATLAPIVLLVGGAVLLFRKPAAGPTGPGPGPEGGTGPGVSRGWWPGKARGKPRGWKPPLQQAYQPITSVGWTPPEDVPSRWAGMLPAALEGAICGRPEAITAPEFAELRDAVAPYVEESLAETAGQAFGAQKAALLQLARNVIWECGTTYRVNKMDQRGQQALAVVQQAIMSVWTGA